MGYECLVATEARPTKRRIWIAGKGRIQFNQLTLSRYARDAVAVDDSQYNFPATEGLRRDGSKEKTFGTSSWPPIQTCIAVNAALQLQSTDSSRGRGKGMRVQTRSTSIACGILAYRGSAPLRRPYLFPGWQLKTVKGKYGETCSRLHHNFIERKATTVLVYYPMTLTHPPFMPTRGRNGRQGPAEVRQEELRRHGGVYGHGVGRVLANSIGWVSGRTGSLLHHNDACRVQSRWRCVVMAEGSDHGRRHACALIAAGEADRERPCAGHLVIRRLPADPRRGHGARMPKGMPVDAAVFCRKCVASVEAEGVALTATTIRGWSRQGTVHPPEIRAHPALQLYSDGRLFEVRRTHWSVIHLDRARARGSRASKDQAPGGTRLDGDT